MENITALLQKFRTNKQWKLYDYEVKEVRFSGSTYFLKVINKKSGEEYWPFFQFESEKIKDYFCSCEDENIETFCIQRGLFLRRRFCVFTH